MEKVTTLKIGPDGLNRGLCEAAEILRSGGVALLPTETVYGLCAHPRRPDAVRRLYEIKGRVFDKPLQLLIEDISAARDLGAEITPAALHLMNAFWPGPLTLVLRTTGTPGTIGLRMPAHPIASRLIRLCGGALWATSANISGMAETADFISAMRLFHGIADAAIDGGRSAAGISSTVVDLSGAGAAVLRPGSIPATEIMRVAGRAPRR